MIPFDPETCASQFLRAIRGPRSQIAFARRLGYRANPIADWENGRRYPTAPEAIRACERVGRDVIAAFRDFHPEAARGLESLGAPELAVWMTRLKGATSIAELAQRTGRTRHQVGRWLSGASKPRLPDWLRLVEAMTGRVSDLLAELCDITALSAIAPLHHARVRARRLAFEHPWTAALLRVLECADYRAEPRPAGWIAERLGLPPEAEEELLGVLTDAGIVQRDAAGRLEEQVPLTVDTRAGNDAVRRLKTHWARVATERIATMRETDLFSYNLFSCSRADAARIREMQRATYREIRSIVAASEPCEAVGLVYLQFVEW